MNEQIKLLQIFKHLLLVTSKNLAWGVFSDSHVVSINQDFHQHS